MFLIISFLSFLTIVGLYFLISGIFVFVFQREEWLQKQVNFRPRPQEQTWYEIKSSLITAGIFAIGSTVLIALWLSGKTAIYQEINEYGYIYFFLSPIISILIHDAYYYWLHRCIHQKLLYRLFHQVHHATVTTSPWTALSFHPLESIFQYLIFFPLIIFLPLHPLVILFHFGLMTITNTMHHLNIEIIPENFRRLWLSKFWIDGTNHGQHHAQFNVNYGLYFTFWDYFCGTANQNLEK